VQLGNAVQVGHLAPVPLSPRLGRKSLRDMGGPYQIVSLAAASSMSDPVYATYQTGARPYRSCTFAAGRCSSRAGLRSARPLCIAFEVSASICSATLQQVLLKTIDMTKILIPFHLHQILILNEHLHQCSWGAWEQLFVFLTVECFLTWILIAHLMHYPINVEFPRVF
jgi:hypothetical protein